MYPSNTSPPQPWQQEEGSDRSRYPPIEGSAYPAALDQHSHYYSARGEQPPNGFTGREDGNRHPSREDNRYNSREHAYTRYPQREEVGVPVDPPPNPCVAVISSTRWKLAFIVSGRPD